MFISEIESEKILRNVTSKILKNRNTKNESFRILSALFGVSGKLRIQKAEYRIHLTDSSVPTKVLPTDHAFCVFSFLFLLLFISAIMEVAGCISSKHSLLNDRKDFMRERASLCLVSYELLQTNLIAQTSNWILPFF